eukprot:scaffold193216_cov34-Prasinocladus_malaysianus.AAC.1
MTVADLIFNFVFSSHFPVCKSLRQPEMPNARRRNPDMLPLSSSWSRPPSCRQDRPERWT